MANQEPEETLSCEVSAVLDYLGYHPDTINFRRKSYECRVDLFNKCASSGQCPHPFTLYLTKSKEDGTSVWDSGDEDWMLEVDKFEENQDSFYVCIEENITPGYTKLQLASQSHTSFQQHSLNNIFVRSSIMSNGFLSSQFMNKAFYDKLRCLSSSFVGKIVYGSFRLVEDDSCNPKVAFTFRIRTGLPWHTVNIVPAFSYASPDKYRNWSCRKREHGWPPRPVVEKLIQLPVHVVPKGQKGSDDCAQEFRICYTYAEIELMKILNETQTKVYVLLKLLFKSVINKKFPDIVTSYVLKNVVFWISEQTPLKEFTDALLLRRFQTALKFIIQGLQEGNLPNYFIPERNLLLGRLRPETKVQLLINCLSEFVSDGFNCVVKIPAIEQGLHTISKDGWEYIGFCRNVVEVGLVYVQMFWFIVYAREIQAFLALTVNLLKSFVG